MSKIDILGVLQGVDYCLSLTGNEKTEEIEDLITTLSLTAKLLTEKGSQPKTVRRQESAKGNTSPSITNYVPKATSKPIDGTCQYCYTVGSLIQIDGSRNGKNWTYIKCTVDTCKKGYYVKD